MPHADAPVPEDVCPLIFQALYCPTPLHLHPNAIAPGYMATELTANMKEVNPKQYEEITGRIPMGRWGNPEDLQGLVVFLASDASAYISGAVIPVDGGFMGK